MNQLFRHLVDLVRDNISQYDPVRDRYDDLQVLNGVILDEERTAKWRVRLPDGTVVGVYLQIERIS